LAEIFPLAFPAILQLLLLAFAQIQPLGISDFAERRPFALPFSISFFLLYILLS
jgi:hypothetical protein